MVQISTGTIPKIGGRRSLSEIPPSPSEAYDVEHLKGVTTSERKALWSGLFPEEKPERLKDCG